jgi:hypothetical protein
MAVSFFSGKFYFNSILIIGTCAAIDYFTRAVDVLFRNSLAGKLMVLRSQKNSIENSDDLPEMIVEKLKMYDVYSSKKKENEVKGNGDKGVINHEEYELVNVKDLNKIG